MDEEEKTAHLRINIRENIYGFIFHVLHMPNPETVEMYMDELKVHVYIKALNLVVDAYQYPWVEHVVIGTTFFFNEAVEMRMPTNMFVHILIRWFFM